MVYFKCLELTRLQNGLHHKKLWQSKDHIFSKVFSNISKIKKSWIWKASSTSNHLPSLSRMRILLSSHECPLSLKSSWSLDPRSRLSSAVPWVWGVALVWVHNAAQLLFGCSYWISVQKLISLTPHQWVKSEDQILQIAMNWICGNLYQQKVYLTKIPLDKCPVIRISKKLT